jgi:hypothetical protein
MIASFALAASQPFQQRLLGVPARLVSNALLRTLPGRLLSREPGLCKKPLVSLIVTIFIKAQAESVMKVQRPVQTRTTTRTTAVDLWGSLFTMIGRADKAYAW